MPRPPLALVLLFSFGSLLAGCVGGTRVSKDIVDLARQTRLGGAFVIEVDAEGNVINADAQIDMAMVPAAVMAAADREVPGPAVEAEKEIAANLHYWEIEKKVDGRSIQLMIDDDGKLVGKEEELDRAAWPKHVVDAANAAVPDGEITTIELVTGPEALGGTEYHVKKNLGSEVLRISVLENGKATRFVRKIKSEFKPPR